MTKMKPPWKATVGMVLEVASARSRSRISHRLWWNMQAGLYVHVVSMIIKRAPDIRVPTLLYRILGSLEWKNVG